MSERARGVGDAPAVAGTATKSAKERWSVTNRPCSIAPIFTELAAGLGKTPIERLVNDSDAYSRALIAATSFFKPDLLWLNFARSPELEYFRVLVSKGLDDPSSASDLDRSSFDDQLSVYVNTLVNVRRVHGMTPVITAVPGHGFLRSILPEAANFPAYLRDLTRLTRKAISEYAAAGAAAICVVDRGDSDSDLAHRAEYATIARFIHSLGLASIHFARGCETAAFQGLFDCQVIDLGEKSVTSEGLQALAVDPTVSLQEVRVRLYAALAESVGSCPFVTTSCEIPPSMGVPQAKTLVDEMETAINQYIRTGGERATSELKPTGRTTS